MCKVGSIITVISDCRHINLQLELTSCKLLLGLLSPDEMTRSPGSLLGKWGIQLDVDGSSFIMHN